MQRERFFPHPTLPKMFHISTQIVRDEKFTFAAHLFCFLTIKPLNWTSIHSVPEPKMEKFEAYVVFIAATYKPSNTIWPVNSFATAPVTKQHHHQVCLNHNLLLQLCLTCYSLIGILPTMLYRPVSLHYPQRTVNKKVKITRKKFNEYICHHCNTFLAVSHFLSFSFLRFQLVLNAMIPCSFYRPH